MKLYRLFSLALVAVSLQMIQASAIELDPEQALLADFPPKSINSVERAEEAIRRAPAARDYMVNRFTRENAECLERFFAASCLSDMHTRERKARKMLRQVEVEARAFLRKERAAQHERAVAEREQRAAQQSGKSIPFSGAAREKSGEQSPGGENRESAKRRVQVQRVPESGDVAPDSGTPSDEPAPTPEKAGAGGETTELAPAAPSPSPSAPSSSIPEPSPAPAEPQSLAVPEVPQAAQVDLAPQPAQDGLPIPEPLPVAGVQAMPEPQPAQDTLPVSEPMPELKPAADPEPQPPSAVTPPAVMEISNQ